MKNSGHGKQRQLWEIRVVNTMRAVKVSMNEALEGAGMSRELAVDAINRLAHLAGFRQRASQAMMNKWLNPEAEQYPPPLIILQLFCQALENNGPLAVYVSAFPGAHLVSEAELHLLEWAKTYRLSRKAQKEARMLAQKAGVE